MCKLVVVFLPLLSLAGCGAADPCKDVVGACITARVEGSATGLDQLRVSLDGTAMPQVSPPVPSAFSLPVRLAITLPSGIAMKTTSRITISGLSKGVVVASGLPQDVATPAGAHVSATFVLSGITAADGGVSDMSANPDGPSGDVIVSPPTAAFPDTRRGTTSPTTLTFTLSNNGAKTVTPTDATSTGDTSAFATDDTLSTCKMSQAIAPGVSCTVIMKFTPPTSGMLSQSTTVHFDNGGTVTFTATGNGVAYWAAESVTGATRLNAVWGSTALDVYAVGESPNGPVFHTTGDGQWQPYGTGITALKLNAVFGSDAQHVWAGGDNGVIYSSTGGGVWQLETGLPDGGITGNIKGLWAGGPTDVWAVTDSGSILHSSGIGSAWSEAANAGGPLLAVSGFSSHVAAAGEKGQIFVSESNWTMPILPSPAVPLHGVWYQPKEPSDFFVVGEQQGGAGPAIIWHWMQNNVFQEMPDKVMKGLNAISGRIDPMTMAPDVYVVGYLGGGILHSNGGGTWQLVPIPTHAALYGVYVAPTGEVFAVGDVMGMGKGAEVAHLFN